MAAKLVETIYGKTKKNEIYAVDRGLIGEDITFYVQRDGREVYSTSSLADAVRWINAGN